MPDGRDGAPETQYNGSMIKGSVQTVLVPDESQLEELTAQVKDNNQVAVRD